jgi:hypothetical protein
MSTTLPQHHHHRLHLDRPGVIAAGVALLALLTAGAFLEASTDDAPTTTHGPELPSSLPQHHLRGSGHTETSWNYAGTTSGGHVMLGE